MSFLLRTLILKLTNPDGIFQLVTIFDLTVCTQSLLIRSPGRVIPRNILKRNRTVQTEDSAGGVSALLPHSAITVCNFFINL